MKFNQLLTKHIDAAGFPSKRAFADASGINRETLRKYAAGSRIPTNQSFGKICAGLGLRSDAKQRLAEALAQAREEGSSAKKRSYGVGATAALCDSSDKTEVETDEAKIHALVETFFEHSNTERDETLEHFLRLEYSRILNKGK